MNRILVSPDIKYRKMPNSALKLTVDYCSMQEASFSEETPPHLNETFVEIRKRGKQ